MTKWEYQVAPIPLHNETLMLNNFGRTAGSSSRSSATSRAAWWPSSSARKEA